VALVTSTSPIGTGREMALATAAVRVVGAPTSLTDPQAWHSPHRPTHFTVAQPHSAHRKELPRVTFAMPKTLDGGTDNHPGRTAYLLGART